MVDRELFDAYQRALGTLSGICKEAVEKMLAEAVRIEDATERAAFMLAEYERLTKRYGVVSADVTREFYQAVRDAAELEDEYTAQAASEMPAKFCELDVRECARDGMGYLPGKAVRRVMGRSDETIRINCKADPAKPKWAIVPHAGACMWCVMVASNGWAYHSERSVRAQRHENCRCSICVDFDAKNPKLDGYDPKALKKQWQESGFKPTKGGSKAAKLAKEDKPKPMDDADARKQANRLLKGTSKMDRDEVMQAIVRADEKWKSGQAHSVKADNQFADRIARLMRDYDIGIGELNDVRQWLIKLDALDE